MPKRAQKPDPLQAWLDRMTRQCIHEGTELVRDLLDREHTPSPIEPVSPFVVLGGLSAQASRPQVDAAFRALAAVAHPDKPTGETGWFQTITAARDAIYVLRGWK